MDLVLSGRVRKAFDTSEESPELRARYGTGWGEQALLARRLVEASAGAPVHGSHGAGSAGHSSVSEFALRRRG